MLHLGPEEKPALLVIDGGPADVYNKHLGPRLKQLREARSPRGKLAIDLAMISHIDDDHIRGILDWTYKLRARREDRRELDYRIKNLWHNSFNDVLGHKGDALFTTGASRDEVSASGMVLASVGQGQELRDNAKKLTIPVNRYGGVKVAASEHPLIVAGSGHDPLAQPIVKGLKTWVVGPSKKRVERLHKEWQKVVKEQLAAKEKVATVAKKDYSPYNLSSIVVLLEFDGKKMLLTGDARGDDILAGLRDAKLLDQGGTLHVDLLKMPHHGSSGNVDAGFFCAIRARHYVVSGNGEHGNPEVKTFRMLFDSRRGDRDPFTIHLTYPPEEYVRDAHKGLDYPVEELRDLFKTEGVGERFQLVTPGAQDHSVRIDLKDEYPRVLG